MSQSANHPSDDYHNEVTVETLRTPPLRIQPGPALKRVVAAVIDSLIACAVYLLILLSIHQKFANPFLVSAEYLTAMFIYYFLQESAFASTIGKSLLGLRVVGNSGDPVSTREALIRNLLRFVDWLPVLYMLGALALVLSSKKQRIGDIVAGTMVTIAAERDINPPPAPFLFH